MFKSKTEEAKLASKVRRLHGKQTEEELEEERQKSMPQKGSLAAILASAKENIKKEKSKLNGGQNSQNSEGDSEGKIDEGSLSERMMALRAKTLGESVTHQKEIVKSNKIDPPIQKTNPPTGNFGTSQSTISSDYLNDIKDRHESMYSAVRMSEIKKRPTAAIHLPKKKAQTKLINPSEKLEKAVSKPKTTPTPIAKTKSIVVEKPKTKSISPTITKSTTVKKSVNLEKKVKSDKDKPVFTKAETKKLIEEAVKIALKKVGKIE
ncbi:hypothetical protein [Spiroplasma alleghenense]|nr:hypothetical protein [Spiroplasma alleghenense]